MIIYYIIPLLGMLLLTKGYTYVIDLIPESDETNFAINFMPIAMKVTFNIILANICITTMFILMKDMLNTKFIIEVEQKVTLTVICIIIMLLAVAKIGVGIFMQSRINTKVSKLNEAMQTNTVEKYLEIDFKPKMLAHSKTEDIRPKNKDNYDTILLKYEAEFLEATYKMETADVRQEIKTKGKPKNSWKTKRTYSVECKKYVDRLAGHKQNITRQNISYIVIYLSEILCAVWVFVRNEFGH